MDLFIRNLYTSQSNGLIITLEDHLFTEKGKGILKKYSKLDS